LRSPRPRVPVLGLGSQALINLIYVLLLSLGMLVPTGRPALAGIAVLAVAVVGRNDSITILRRARRTAAGSAALIASATRNTWTLLVFGRTQGLAGARRFGVALLLSKVDTRPSLRRP
jgi:hypothetical protein